MLLAIVLRAATQLLSLVCVWGSVRCGPVVSFGDALGADVFASLLNSGGEREAALVIVC